MTYEEFKAAYKEALFKLEEKYIGRPNTEFSKDCVAYDYVYLHKEFGIDLSLDNIICIKNISSIDCMPNGTGENIIKKYLKEQLYLKVKLKNESTDNYYVDFKRFPFSSRH